MTRAKLTNIAANSQNKHDQILAVDKRITTHNYIIAEVHENSRSYKKCTLGWSTYIWHGPCMIGQDSAVQNSETVPYKRFALWKRDIAENKHMLTMWKPFYAKLHRL